MVEKQVTYNGLRDMRLGAIRHRLEQSKAAYLSGPGAVRLLEWAQTCAEGREKAELLALFAAAGGMEIIQGGTGPMH